MPNPHTLRQKVREDAERAINRRMQQDQLDDDDLDRAVDEWDLNNYREFFSDCREEGTSTSRCGAIWTKLKERGDAPTKDDGDPDVGNDDAPASAAPALPIPENVEQIEDAITMADAVYLVVTTGCPTCNQVKEQLSSWIDSGDVEVANVQDSDKAADIVMETGLEAVPSLVLENDGEYITV